MDNPFELILARQDRIEAMLSELLSRTVQPSTVPVDERIPIPIKEASLILNLAISTIHSNIQSIPHIKRHGRLYFYRNELLDYIKEGSPKVTNTSFRPARKRRIKKSE